MNLDELRDRWKQPILEVAARHGARNVRVFGSVLRDDVEPHDLDLLVDMEKGRSLLDLVFLSEELEATLGLPVDVVTSDEISPYMRKVILDRAEPL